MVLVETFFLVILGLLLVVVPALFGGFDLAHVLFLPADLVEVDVVVVHVVLGHAHEHFVLLVRLVRVALPHLRLRELARVHCQARVHFALRPPRFAALVLLGRIVAAVLQNRLLGWS